MLQPITKDDFDLVNKTDKYYNGRWSYIHAAALFTKPLAPKSAIELGPYRLPLYKGCDVIDNDETKLPDKSVYNEWFNFDASVTPWPFKDKSYDLFAAMQVWEHLADDQDPAPRVRAFREVKRIAKAAVMSFPYKWVGIYARHDNVDEAMINAWTDDEDPIFTAIRTQSVVVGTHEGVPVIRSLRRIVYLWKFDETEK